MKRSSVYLVAASVFALAACSPPAQQAKAPQAPAAAPPPLYASVDECVTAGNDKALCTQAIQNAAASTPRFAGATAKAECEAQFGSGNCESRSDSSGDWVGPALMGFMIGNMLSDNNRGYSSNGYYRGGSYDRDYNTYRRDSNRPTRTYSAPSYSAPATTYKAPAAAPTKTVTRNGFSTATPPSSAARPKAVTATTTVGSAPVVSANRAATGGSTFGSKSSAASVPAPKAPAYAASQPRTSSFGSSSPSKSSSFGSSSSSRSYASPPSSSRSSYSSSSSRSSGGFGGSRSSSGSR